MQLGKGTFKKNTLVFFSNITVPKNVTCNEKAMNHAVKEFTLEHSTRQPTPKGQPVTLC